MRPFTRFLPLSVLLAAWANVVMGGCPDGQSRGAFGWCYPNVGGSVGQGAQHLKEEFQAQTAGPALELWINQSRNTSINGAQPIPDFIRQLLTGYIDDDVMSRARFRVGDNGVLNLGGLSIRYGDVNAITLYDVIVFRNADDAYYNPSLWAHELTHVQQFRDWGVHAFALRYARDYSGVEGPAYAKGNGYAQWAATSPNAPIMPPTPVQPAVAPSGYVSGTAVQACGCWGPTTGFNPAPICASGAVQAVVCPGMCPAGGSPYGWVCQ